MPLKPDMSNDLRSMVRDVLREVMVSRTQPGLAMVEPVRLSNDSELTAFVARIIEPATLEKITSGKLRFTLHAEAAANPDCLNGVITEQKLDNFAGTGSLLLGPGAVLTPLARDKARRLGLKIERRR